MADGEATLLRRYAEHGDAEAFRALVQRHQGMVFAVCHRVLGNAADAEDAAQNCFLRLARRARRLRAPIGGWLHNVAVGAAVDMLRQNGARYAREAEAAERKANNHEPAWDEVKGEVDKAIAELPEDLRVPIVLHYLEGRKQKQIAAELGITQGAVSKRLQRGAEALRERMAEAGFALTGAALVSMLSAHAIEVAPAALAAALGKMALSGIGAGKALTIGGLSGMKLALVFVSAAAVVTVGAVTIAGRTDETPVRAEPPVQPQTVEEPTAQTIASPYDTIAPYVLPETFAVFRLDVEKVDLHAVFEKGMAMAQDLGFTEEEIAQRSGRMEVEVDAFARRTDQFRQAGGREWFVVLGGLGDGHYSLAPVTPDADVRAIRGLLFSGEVDGPVAGDRPRTMPFHEVCEQVGDIVYAGPAERLEQLRAAQIAAPPRPKLAEAHAAVQGMTAQLLFIPTEQMYDFLDAQGDTRAPGLGTAGSIADMLRKLKWLAVGLDATPKLRLKSVWQCHNAQGAKDWHDLLTRAAEMATFAGFAIVAPTGVPGPAVEGDRVVIEWNEEDLHELIVNVPLLALIRQRAAAIRTKSLVQVRQQTVGCIMYANDHDGEWPERLDALMPDYLADEGLLKNPRQPEREAGYVYVRPDPMPDPQAVVIYEAHDEWPQDGLVVGFVDGHVETVEDEGRFKELLQRR